MNEFELNKLLNDSNKLNDKIQFYLDKKVLMKQNAQKNEILGHIAKAEHNLEFINDIKNEFNDWILVACYYTSYHMALALILTKGYYSKNHDATLSVLIKQFYKKELTREDFELLNKFDVEDILFYVQSMKQREDASYSTKILFDKKNVNDIKLKTILFVNKSKEIIKTLNI